jgi:hypothetical protein
LIFQSMRVLSQNNFALHLAGTTILLSNASQGFFDVLPTSIPGSFLALITCNSCAHFIFLSCKA